MKQEPVPAGAEYPLLPGPHVAVTMLVSFCSKVTGK